MNVSCPDCGSIFRVDPAKVPDVGVEARCSVCGGIIPVSRERASAPAAGVAAATPGFEAARTAGDTGAAERPRTPPIVPERVEPAPAEGDASGDVIRPAAAAERMTAGAKEEPAGARRERDGSRDVTPPSTSDRVAPDPSASAVPRSDTATGPSGPIEGRTRPVNPYLNNTPELRARRLARALVSDLVAYNPQKREQGLRDGTLRQLFREEIRKSWDEYVEQVGATVAESTPHFQDALNDVLAGGRRVF